MDAFDPIRDTAARLYTALVTKGADPSHSWGMVEAAIHQLALELVWLPAGDPVLKGACALFDEQSGTICCSVGGEAARHVERIAHEIGHACLHGTSSQCTAHDIDASRSTEAAPVGLQRVEDYGTRERRELQANVFAREFLLPRAEARRWHRTERLGATAIADRLQLPKDLVRQQLLDALLLPDAPPSNPEPTERGVRPDPSQDAAAGHRGSAFQLQAGPGTGKTRTLVTRVVSLVNEGIDPGTILVLTFSNRAAGELLERLAAAVPTSAPTIWIGTFHAFGLELIRRYHDRLGLPPDPPLFDRSDAIEVLEELLPTLPLVHYRNLWDPALILRDMVAAISRAKDELTDPARYRALAHAMLKQAADNDARKTAEQALEVAQVYEYYEGALRARRAVDFGDLVMRPAFLLETDDAVRVATRLRHRHVLVDEYQDVNRAGARLLRAVAGDGRRLWVVGDSRQSIYRFRGASSANMTAFTDEYPDVAVGQLSINYRSSQEIVETVNGFAPHMGASHGMRPLALTADRGSTATTPQVRRFDTLDQETAGLAASIRELEAAGVRLRDQAVLCRANGRLNEIAAALEARGIPVLHLGSLFERDEVRDLLALLSLAVDPFGDGLARVGAMPRYDLSLQDVRTMTLCLRDTDQAALEKLASVVATAALSEDGARGVARLSADLDGLTMDASPWEFLTTYLLDRTDLLAAFAAGDTAAARMRAVAIWQFLNFIRERSPTGSGLPIQRTLDRVRQLVLLAEERDLRHVPAGALHMDAVRLMTVHGSKGLEFEAVHVPGLTVSSFPSAHRSPRCPAPDGMIMGAEHLTGAAEARRAHRDEEECLCFVAASRARTHLRLYLARQQPNGTNRAASPYLRWLSAAGLEEVPRPPTLPIPPDALRPALVPVAWPNGWHVTDATLRLYEQCPRRFFYTHVLGLGGARKDTAFTRTHECLHTFMQWLSAARLSGDIGEDMALCEFERIWQANGPTDHAFAADYRRLADRLVRALVRLGARQRFRQVEPLALDFPNGRVLVQPDETTELPNGTVVLRRVRTGAKRRDEDDRLEYTLYHLAARARYGAAYAVEALHLTDERVETVAVSPTKMENRRAKSEELVVGITAGRFAPATDAVRCPRCPHFFICAATPRGPLTRT
jgi:DNA helicase II / ATP-dependent DNA helicase PcrA